MPSSEVVRERFPGGPVKWLAHHLMVIGIGLVVVGAYLLVRSCS